MDRTWLITGSSAGFGRALAYAALAAGDNVVATARRPEALNELVAIAPQRTLAVALDVTDRAQIDAAVAAVTERFGGIDVLVNNAGLASVGAVEELDDGQLRGLMDTMYFGPIAVLQAVLPGMRAKHTGTVVQMSSMGGQVSMPGFGAYCAAKFALEAVSEALAAEVAPFGIRVLIVEPGAFATSFGGSRAQVSPDSGLYDQTVGPQRTAVGAMDGSQPGDPAKAATAILQALDASTPPLRLALGADAVKAIGSTPDTPNWTPGPRSATPQPANRQPSDAAIRCRRSERARRAPDARLACEPSDRCQRATPAGATSGSRPPVSRSFNAVPCFAADLRSHVPRGCFVLQLHPLPNEE